ncbi:moonshiner isoform X2 [Drosophila ficusphila]|uniref:moonshiner isoform X2 n=1 Tax=Drosophila ficusphila TaxID=30025 RepID=UPI0007E79543|nr:moonshiner isoform X2 [Drosophila ficusphila]XP_017056381.1 moonshiner isoform X2 [Drosophila ficusphila]
MGGRKETFKPTNGVWIDESCHFPQEVIKDTINSLSGDVVEFSTSELKSLNVLKRRWMQKLEDQNRQPESNPRPPSPKKPRKRTQNQISKKAPPTEEDRAETNVFKLGDDVIVENRIHIPRLNPKWRMRHFDIMMPANVLKRGLLNDHFNWELLNQVMEANDQEGTAILQQFVDNVVKKLST